MKFFSARGLILLSIVSALSGCTKEAEPTPDIAVPVIKADCSPEAEAEVYYGQIKGKYESALSFMTGGKIAFRRIKTGSTLKTGDILMELDTADIKESFKTASARLDEAKSRLNFAKADYARQSSLFKDEIISKAKFEESSNNLEIALSFYKQAEASYRQSKNLTEYAVLRSPWDATVTEIYAEAGQVVSQGQPVMTIIKNGIFEAEFYVPENKLQNFAEGAAVSITLWAARDKTLNAVIGEISPKADKKTGSFKIRAEITDPPEFLRPGMTASIKAKPVNPAQNGCFVPSSAVYGENGGHRIWIFDNGAVRSKAVTAIKYENDRIKITGLGEDDLLAASGTHKLSENLRVRALFPEKEVYK